MDQRDAVFLRCDLAKDFLIRRFYFLMMEDLRIIEDFLKREES